MKPLIIYAHPATKGHCSTILGEVKKRLKDYELIDLYKLKYDPVMHENEHYTSGNYEVSKQNKKFQKMISGADKLIFIYPVWWASMPAILKGFVDKVFTSHYAFKYVKGIPRGLLKGKKAAVFMSMGGPKWVTRLFLGNRAAKIMKKDILRFCGISSKVFQIGKATKLDQKQIRKIKIQVKKGLKYLR